MKKLGGMDAGFLYAETPQTPMHVAGLSVLQLPSGDRDDFYAIYKEHIAKRLHLMSVLTMKLVPSPYDIDHPVWVADPDIDLDYHIRHLGLPRPGTMQQLEELVGRLHSNFLDRSRPLWEFYVIDGLADGQVAVYTKMHHAAVDGGAGMALTQVMYDTTPVPREVEPPPPAAPRSAEPDAMMLIGAAYRNFLNQQIDALRKLPDVMKAVADLARPDLAQLTRNLRKPPQLTAPKTMLNVSITSQRSFTALSLPLAEAKALAKATESKLNEVVLAISAGALRRYLHEHDNLPKDSLMAMVPVSLREPGNTDTNNQVSAMLCSLATDIADPLERLHAIREASGEAKQFTGKIKDATPRDFSVFGAPLWIQGMASFAARARLADNLPSQANVVISNVPGPQSPLYLAGAKMLTLYPVSIPAHGMALNITVQSYGQMERHHGVPSCHDAGRGARTDRAPARSAARDRVAGSGAACGRRGTCTGRRQAHGAAARARCGDQAGCGPEPAAAARGTSVAKPRGGRAASRASA